MLNSAAVQRSPWVVGNWKMNGGLSDNEALLSGLLGLLEAHAGRPVAQCAVAVPAPYLFQSMVRLSGHSVGWGSQDVSAERSGAFTGEFSVAMLRILRPSFRLLGTQSVGPDMRRPTQWLLQRLWHWPTRVWCR